MVRAEDLNLVLPGLSQAERKTLQGQGGGRAYRQPIKPRKTGHSAHRILVGTGHFYQTRNLSKSNRGPLLSDKAEATAESVSRSCNLIPGDRVRNESQQQPQPQLGVSGDPPKGNTSFRELI